MHPSNLLSRVQDVALMAPAVRTVTTNGTFIDISDFEGVGLIVLTSTAEASTGTMDLSVQDSADGSTPVGTLTLLDGVFTQVTNAGASQQIRRIDCNAANKFIRAVQTVGGGSPSATAAVSFIGTKKVMSA